MSEPPAGGLRSHVTLILCTILHAFTHAYGTLLVPLYLRDVVFLGHLALTSPLSEVDGAALAAGGIYVAVVAAGIGTLLYRYRWVER